VGSIDGAADVSPTGAATYTIPIKCPKGTNNMKPQVSMVYNSQSGSGLLGMGWNISGLSAITRVGKNKNFDDETSPLSFSSGDRYVLDGTRLLLKSGVYGQSGSTYETETESFAEITAMNAQGSGPEWIRVRSKDGTISDYGATTGSRFMDESGQHVWMWRLSRVTDPNGNYIDYIYDTQNG